MRFGLLKRELASDSLDSERFAGDSLKVLSAVRALRRIGRRQHDPEVG